MLRWTRKPSLRSWPAKYSVASVFGHGVWVEVEAVIARHRRRQDLVGGRQVAAVDQRQFVGVDRVVDRLTDANVVKRRLGGVEPEVVGAERLADLQLRALV